ncbi:MAG: hypothetical protein MJ233_04885 [Mycoplasmoidaceae bacterium]|nr:hypothetical protein [Mycoplasmoidaceae bacterium]
MLQVIIALLVIFLCLFAAGVAVYTVFFAIHKRYFRQEINLIKKYNKLINDLNGINIYKIQVLANNDIGNKLDLNKYILIYRKLKSNSVIIKNNISIAEAELNAFNLKTAKKYILTIDNDLNKALKDFEILKEAYARYTQYGHAIEFTFQNYLEIFEALQDFYETKLVYTANFKKVNDLFVAIRKTFETLPSLSIRFDYKKTVDTFLDLIRKLKTLANAIMLIFRFQIVDTYLKSTKEYNEKMISKYHSEIASSDLQKLQNLLTLFNHAYSHFSRHYRNLELGQAQAFAAQAVSSINQVNQFTYIHVKTPTLISLSLNEIKDQTDKIMASRHEIIDSIKDLKQYFVLEPKVIDCFDVIEKDVNYIAILNNAANHVNYKTHTEKIKAIKDLDTISQQIIKRKLEIVRSIDSIDNVLGKIIKTVTDLNDLYVYFWQLLTIVKKYVPTGLENREMQMLIKNNLQQIENYSKLIVSEENPDFDAIAYEISSIIEQSQQIYKRMTSTIVLKTYASKLFVYVNRYKSIKELKEKFAKANQSFKAKNYSQCIDELLAIIKQAKKNKK